MDWPAKSADTGPGERKLPECRGVTATYSAALLVRPQVVGQTVWLSHRHRGPAPPGAPLSPRSGTGETGRRCRRPPRCPTGPKPLAKPGFRVDSAAKALPWGSEGPNDYHGQMEVADTSTVTLEHRADRDRSNSAGPRADVHQHQPPHPQRLNRLSALRVGAEQAGSGHREAASAGNHDAMVKHVIVGALNFGEDVGVQGERGAHAGA